MNIILNEDQEKQYNDILKIFEKSKIAINIAVMGSGKTYVTCKLGELFDSMLVICPANIEYIWENMSAKYDLDINVISYDNLSSIKGKQPSHNFLTGEDEEGSPPIFTCTEKLSSILTSCCS